MPGALADTLPRAAAPQADRRVIAALLALATLAAAALRLPFLATQSLWFDETYTARVVDAGSLATLWDRIGASESTPPLYYLLTWAWVHAFGGEGEGALRAVSALAVVAAVPVAWFALRRFVGACAALAVAALLAVSPLLTWYALDARAYGLLVLTGLLSVWACSAVLERATARRASLWALAAAAAVWTHWFAGFLVLAELVALLWLAPAARRATLLAAGAIGLAVLPLVGLLREQTGDDRAAFIGDAGLLDRIEQLVRQFATGPNVPRSWLEAAALALALAALAAGTLLTARRALRAEPDDRRLAPRDGARALLAIAGVALLVPLALAAVGLYDRFNVRNVLFLWPLAAALAAPALLRLRAAPLAALLALGVATSLWTTTDWRYGNTDWRSAFEHLQVRGPDQPVVAVTPLGQPVAALYLGRSAAGAPLRTRRAWLVVEPARSPGERALQPTNAPLVASLLAAFPNHRETQVHGFRLIALSASEPVALDPAQLPGATLFPAIRSPAG
ncbi:MAG TPA: glycosyltransferase family 39 protein [Conexibacter sp.]|nr:glycosyltransferase family 39 protein [Conexibacter sp.]